MKPWIVVYTNDRIDTVYLLRAPDHWTDYTIATALNQGRFGFEPSEEGRYVIMPFVDAIPITLE